MNKVANFDDFKGSLKIYFQDISRIKSKEDASLAEKYLKLVVYQARKYIASCGLSLNLLPDLVQAGNLELVKAAQHCDRYGDHFIQSATTWIKGAFSREVRFHKYSADISENMARDIRKVCAVKRSLGDKCPEQTKYNQASGIATLLGWKPDKVKNVINIAGQFILDTGKDDSNQTLEDYLLSEDESCLYCHDPAAKLIRKNMIERVQLAMAKLPKREREVIEWRFGFKNSAFRGESLEKIGERLGGIKKQSVAEIEKRAKERLSKHLADLMAA